MTSSDVLILKGGHSTCVLITGRLHLKNLPEKSLNHQLRITRRLTGATHNLKYWGAQSNDGLRMWKSKHEAFEGDGHKFSYDGTNGFLITIHFSGNAKPASAD